jgi:NADH dehydrogenase FAD-containing subunit
MECLRLLSLRRTFSEQSNVWASAVIDIDSDRLITETRANVPEGGFPNDGTQFTVNLTNGQQVDTDFVILATGQKPNNELMDSLPNSNPEGLINPLNGFLRIKKTMQLQDDAYSNIFAVGDIADTGVHKAARPGAAQAKVVATNIVSMISDGAPEAHFEKSPRAIHLSLGLKRNVIFRNPDEANGQTEPTVIEKFE